MKTKRDTYREQKVCLITRMYSSLDNIRTKKCVFTLNSLVLTALPFATSYHNNHRQISINPEIDPTRSLVNPQVHVNTEQILLGVGQSKSLISSTREFPSLNIVFSQISNPGHISVIFS